jgi:hypothetical protein
LATARPDATPDAQGTSIPEIASELWELAVAYAKQETIDPLRGLGRFLAFGIGGAVLLGIGTSMLMLAGLRALQTETGTTFTGSWSWAPYLIVLAVGVLLSALALWRISSRKGPGL